jgi:polyferredoxin
MSAITAPKKKPLFPTALYHRRRIRTQRIRRLVQLSFAGFIIYTSLAHHFATTDEQRQLMHYARLVDWKQPGDIFRVAVVMFLKCTSQTLFFSLGCWMGTLIAGSAFCVWICPFGTVQDVLTWIRTRLHLPEIRVPQRLDRILRYGRFVMLGLILYQTIVSVKLWFATIDPYRTLFGLDWLFEFEPAVAWLAYLSTGIVLISSLFVERAWCRYACPLGGALSLVGKFSLLRIRRSEDGCKGCAICAHPCPVKLPVATSRTISSDCIGCLQCIDTCPRPNTLEVKLAPVWLDLFHKEASDVR